MDVVIGKVKSTFLLSDLLLKSTAQFPAHQNTLLISFALWFSHSIKSLSTGDRFFFSFCSTNIDLFSSFSLLLCFFCFVFFVLASLGVKINTVVKMGGKDFSLPLFKLFLILFKLFQFLVYSLSLMQEESRQKERMSLLSICGDCD